MKPFHQFLNEARKAYTKKGRMFVLKKPLNIDHTLSILAIGRDINGNRLIRVEVPGGKKSVQLGYEVNITIDNLMDGLTDEQIQHIKDSVFSN